MLFLLQAGGRSREVRLPGLVSLDQAIDTIDGCVLYGIVLDSIKYRGNLVV